MQSLRLRFSSHGTTISLSSCASVSCARWLTLPHASKSQSRKSLPVWMSPFQEPSKQEKEPSSASTTAFRVTHHRDISQRTAAPSSSHSSTSSGAATEQLLGEIMPPWPVDEVEFSTAVMPDGGHAWRLRWEQQQNVWSRQFTGPSGADETRRPRSVVQRSVWSATHRAQWEAAEALLAAHRPSSSLEKEEGWVCEGCCTIWSSRHHSSCNSNTEAEDLCPADSVQSKTALTWKALPGAASRTICPECWTPRRDRMKRLQQYFLSVSSDTPSPPPTSTRAAALGAPSAWAAEESTAPRLSWWLCGQCSEANAWSGSTEKDDASVCACCGLKALTAAVLSVGRPLENSGATNPKATGLQDEFVPPDVGLKSEITEKKEEFRVGKGESGGPCEEPHPQRSDAPLPGQDTPPVLGSEAPAPEPSRRTSFSHDDLAGRPLNAVVNPKNRTTRWRCGCCLEINSLQSRRCRHCFAERFHLLIKCPTCPTWRALRNATVYGEAIASEKDADAQDSSELDFCPENCFSPMTVRLRCLQCNDLLHGGEVSWLQRRSTEDPSTTARTPVAEPMTSPHSANQNTGWWCPCGACNTPAVPACIRCRLPRWLPPAQREPVVTKYWDTEGSSHWWCEACQTINPATVRVVGLSEPSPSTGERHKVTRTQRGRSHCTCCGTPWHMEELQRDVVSESSLECHADSSRDSPTDCWWRCSCHAVNRASSRHCVCCALPCRSDISVDTLSAWGKGDWICANCGHHLYKERVVCPCGSSKRA